jgi:folate-dependent phosphoribosylglycinamide formyltransferase PurN
VESRNADERIVQQDKKNMALNNLKIVIWCGAASNQKALANKIAAKYNVTGIVVDTHSSASKKKQWSKLPGLLWDRFRFRKIYNPWAGVINYYEKNFPEWPQGPRIEVPTINNEAAEKFTRELQPDLIVVSGTALIKEPLISLPVKTGMINLHTGLSPYVKGGPNCTNWCIANNTFHLVGNTIMWLNAGIDTGNLITTETVNIQNAETLSSAHQMVMEHAHDLYLKAIDYLANSERPYNSIPQDSIAKGSLYLTRMWTGSKKKQLLKNWKKRTSFTTTEAPVTVPLMIQ